MYNFINDYSEGAHKNILNKLIETNLQQQLGYGQDEYSNQAKTLLKQKINNPNANIYFVSGGTQTNLYFFYQLYVLVVSSHYLFVHFGYKL